MKKYSILVAVLCLLLCVAFAAVSCDDTNPGEENSSESSGVTDNSEATEESEETDGTEGTTEEQSSEPAEVAYTVTVKDADGAPIAGVGVQFCDTTGCRLPITTDESGTLSFSNVSDDPHVTITKLPDGYSLETEGDIYFEDGVTTLEITLVKN